MGLFPVIVGVVDASGNRIDLSLTDGTRPEIQLAIGSGLAGAGALNGEKSIVTLSAPIVTTATAGIAPRALGNNKVLTTDGSGVPTWVDKSSLTPAAELVIGRVLTKSTTYATITGFAPHPALDSNPILWAEGGLALSHAGYTTKSAVSRLRVTGYVSLSGTSGTIYVASLHIGTGNAIETCPNEFTNSGYPSHLGPFSYDVASPGAAQSYAPKLRVTPVIGNTDFYINGASSGATLGGLSTWVEVVEYIPAP